MNGAISVWRITVFLNRLAPAPYTARAGFLSFDFSIQPMPIPFHAVKAPYWLGNNKTCRMRSVYLALDMIDGFEPSWSRMKETT
jgi:hypothetical protein